MLFESNHQKYSKNDLVAVLKNAGICSGDSICVHSELFGLGKILKTKDEFLNDIIFALCSCVGADIHKPKSSLGTVIVPTFTYDFCKSGVYDKKNSRSEVGILGEYFRKLPNVYRSDDPIFNFAIFGKDTDKYKGFSLSCFGEQSIFKKMIDNNVKFITLGTTDTGCTLVHYCEELLQVPYRYYKNFFGKIIDENSIQKECKIKYFLRKLDMPSILSVPKMKEILIKDKAIKIYTLGSAQIGVMSAKEYFASLFNALKNDNSIFLRNS